MFWKIKTFKGKKEMEQFIETYGNQIEWQEVFIDNGFGIEYRMLTVIQID